MSLKSGKKYRIIGDIHQKHTAKKGDIVEVEHIDLDGSIIVKDIGWAAICWGGGSYILCAKDHTVYIRQDNYNLFLEEVI